MAVSTKAGWVDNFSRIGALVSGVALLLMMLIGAIDVITSKFLDRPIPGAFEATEALMVVSAFLAIGYNQYRKGHIAVQLLTSRLAGRPAAAFELFSHAASLLFFGLLAWQGWLYGLHSLSVMEYESGLISFPVYPAKLLMAFGASMAALQCLSDFFRGFKRLIRGAAAS